MSFEYKMLDNKMLDVSEYTVLNAFIVNIPTEILDMENNFLPYYFSDMYCNGIYIVGSKEPMIYYNSIYIGDKTNKEYIIKSVGDLDNIFKENDNITRGKNVFNGIRDLSKRKYLNTRMYVSGKCTYPLFTNEFIKAVVNSYMRYINLEANEVDNDWFNISKHVQLLNNDYKLVKSVDDLFSYFNIPNTDEYQDLIWVYRILYYDIMEMVKKYNPLSLRLKIKQNIIIGELYESPSARRYKINKLVSTTEDMSVYEKI